MKEDIKAVARGDWDSIPFARMDDLVEAGFAEWRKDGSFGLTADGEAEAELLSEDPTPIKIVKRRSWPE